MLVLAVFGLKVLLGQEGKTSSQLECVYVMGGSISVNY